MSGLSRKEQIALSVFARMVGDPDFPEPEREITGPGKHSGKTAGEFAAEIAFDYADAFLKVADRR